MHDAFAVVNKRVKGSLKVTRAFGAGFLKQVDVVVWISELLQKTDKFLILSSDGLYQYFTNKEAVSEVETFMSMYPEGDPAQHLVEEVLIRAAKKSGMDFYDLLEIPQGEWRRYHDDVSIIIISLQGKYGVHQCKC
ncbi:probable protein phosphatase 2C 23 [Salvia splendens]|uniref:probable protein phosphatase 2C 23 n=1 Tax=Salvia splendens TaxID=180675 RepID=UPI001C2799B5|nr:probable protein phosphatase 2C 23 [Salvia splendens]